MNKSDSKTDFYFGNIFPKPDRTVCKGNCGFTLVESVVSLSVFLITVLGVFTTFSYSVNYNAGNSARAQSLSIIQQEVERLRSAKFTPGFTDSTLVGGVKTPRTITASDGNRFRINTTVDDDPFVADVQINNAKTLKEITVSVTLDRPTPGWQTAVPITVVLRRVRAN